MPGVRRGEYVSDPAGYSEYKEEHLNPGEKNKTKNRNSI